MEAPAHLRRPARPVVNRIGPHLRLIPFLLAPIATLPVTVLAEEAPKGITPFARFTHTYDTNLLNRSDEGTGPAPESDQVNRIEGGAAIDFKLSRQRFTGLAALSNTRHQRFDFRNTDGNAFRLRWDTEIGETLTGFLEGSSVSDQAPIQTGTVFATRRDQDGGIASLAWNFHANYSVLAQYASNRTRFKGPDDTSNDVLSGLNRNDETRYVGLSYQPFSGSSTALLFKQADGDFPSRQIVAPGQTVSNNFEQSETELLTKWKYSEITAFTLSLSSVNREHEEVPSRDFSGTNYRVEVFYKPTVKTSFNLLWGKQIVGVSDVTNSDALARQLGLAMNMELSSKLLLQLAYSPQELRFNGTDGFSTSPRTERLKEGRVGLEFALDPRLTLGTTLKKRSRDSTLANTDYSAESMNVFIRYEH